MRFKRHHKSVSAELEITSFLNLMIILVPVLLVMMVFSRITVVDLKLPDLADDTQQQPDIVKQLEVVIFADNITLNYPSGIQLTNIPKKDGKHDFELLSLSLQEIKRSLREAGIEKRDALILSRPDTDYQALISTIDTVRSFKTVVVTDVVDAALFPVISLGDAPVNVPENVRGAKQ